MNHRGAAPKRKVYRQEIKSTWWLKKKSYFFFMMRELTSVFVAAFVLLYAYELFLLSKGPQVYELFQESLRRPLFLLFYSVAFLFALFHTFTWFGVLSKVQVVRVFRNQIVALTHVVFSHLYGVSACLQWPRSALIRA